MTKGESMKKLKYILLFFVFVFTEMQCQNGALNQLNNGVDLQKQDNTKIKLAQIKQLVKNAVKHFLKVPVENACNDFVHSSVWRKGEIFVMVYNSNGDCLAHGDDIDLIYKNISEQRIYGDKPLIKELLEYKKGGTVGYMWTHAYKVSYVQSIKKNNEQYVIGAGFFPDSNEYKVKQLVESASTYFLKNGKDNTFALINNTRGPFVNGDIYVFAYDMQGVNVADGNNPVFVGQNLLDMVDVKGDYPVKKFIEVAKTKGRGWVEYFWKKEYKKAYVQKVVDPKTKKEYLLAAGYYPYVSYDAVQTFLNKAVQHLKSNGPKIAFADFSNTVGEFVQGPMAIDAYDFEGKSLADGNHPDLVGQNVIKLQDPTGKFIIKDIINIAKKFGKGVVSYMHNNTNTIAFIQVVDMPDGKFILTSKFYPDMKSQSVKSLVKQAVDYLQDHPNIDSFDKFSERSGHFYRGDLNIFVYDSKGTRLVNGINKMQIWRNFIKTTDQDGKPIVQDLIDTAVNGGGWLEYMTRNAKRRIYVQAVEKENISGDVDTFIVGSGYFP